MTTALGFSEILHSSSYWLLTVGHTAGMVIVTQAIMAMKMPDEKSGGFYTWFWKFTTGCLSAFRVAAQIKQQAENTQTGGKADKP